MRKSYVVSMEGPDGVSAVTYEAANDAEAVVEAALIIHGYIDDLDPTTVVEIMRPDATSLDTRPTAEWMARFAERSAATAGEATNPPGTWKTAD